MVLEMKSRLKERVRSYELSDFTRGNEGEIKKRIKNKSNNSLFWLMIELTISETVLFLIPGTKSLCLKFVNNSECNLSPI